MSKVRSTKAVIAIFGACLTASSSVYASAMGLNEESYITQCGAPCRTVHISMHGTDIPIQVGQDIVSTSEPYVSHNKGSVSTEGLFVSLSDVQEMRTELDRIALEEQERLQKQQDTIQVTQVSDSKELSVPNVRSEFKAYMDYRAITSKTSAQYRLQNSGLIWTDDEGFRRYGDVSENCYVVAVGSYYSQQIGTLLRVTLDSGVEFLAVVGDHKSDAHTDALHQHRNGNIVEFLVDTNGLPSICRKTGDMSNADTAHLEGKVVSIEKLGVIEF